VGWEWIVVLVGLVAILAGMALIIWAPYRKIKVRASVGNGKLLNVEVEVDRGNGPDPE
jgi:hypothetical protein